MQHTLEVDLPLDGSPVDVWVAGLFGTASTQDGDSGYTIEDVSSGAQLANQPAMVRVRKNANGLTDGERDRFLTAMGTLNAAGSGRFRDFRDMHVDSPASDEAHFDVGFLPWHRCYLLDLERELQAIDPSVALPYWRFDEPAPSIFTTAFMGVPNANGRLLFTAGHPLESWVTDNQIGIIRSMGFSAGARPSSVLSEADTLALAPFPGVTQYRNFAAMEGNPHGRAHTSFPGSSFIRRIPLAARDPLFFMLHCNVDRIWAKWQWLNELFDPAEAEAFSPSDSGRIGHQLGDTMWPWNQVTGDPRPATVPGGTLAPSPVVARPGPSPMVSDMIDYQGILGGDPLGFDYDDVPFELPAGIV
ncbi:tyrosinase [Sinorhizobium kostiense]|uniref:Tyrosinase n=2 Tax=Sinorhizobium TaxID=28105 RepID=A0ABS4R1Z8_9HYPH|nr:tyrosinase family protein [Sinorhizobium kostiense]MBP2236295.1 tyrosinase [Sinorhizobium kostiense]